MKTASVYTIIPLPVSLSAQLAISHLVAAFVALSLVNDVGLVLALTAAVLSGLTLTLTLQRSLWLLDAAARGIPISLRWHSLLTPLIKRIHAMIAREEEMSDLRKNLVHRVQDTAAQQERNRLARDLHDSIKQQIFSIQMSAAAAQARWTNDPEGARSSIDDVRRSAHEAMVEMNALLQELAPAPLEKVGLVQALRDQCEALGYRAGVEVTVDIGDLPDDDLLPAGTQQSVFRMAQEALSNIARHARARHVRVHLGQHEAMLMLEIADDGQGFDINTAEKGMGLTNLQQRVHELGGTLVMNSTPGTGTSLRAAIPFVEIRETQDEIMNITTNHTLNKVALVGIGGGIALIAVLYYPLYILLPHTYLADWQNGSGLLSIILQAVAALVAVGIGYTTARWIKADSRRDGMILGALSGAVASVIAYAGLVGAAAGIVGSSVLIQHGLVPASDQNEMLRLLSESVVGVAWWTHGTFWGVLLAGISLGALGAGIAPPGKMVTSWKDIRFIIIAPLKLAVLISAVAFIVTFAVYSLLEPSVQRSLTSIGFAIPWQLVNGITLLPLGSALAVCVVMMTCLYYVMYAESRGDYAHLLFRHPFAFALPYAMVALTLGLIAIHTLSNEFNFSVRVTLVGGAAMGLILGVAFMKMAFDIWQQRVTAGTLKSLTRWQIASIIGYLAAIPLLPMVWPLALVIFAASLIIGSRTMPPVTGALGLQIHLHSLLVTVTILSLVVLARLPPALSLVLITVPAIQVLASYDPGMTITNPPIMTDLIQSNYMAHLQMLVLVFVITAIIIGLLTFLGWGVLHRRDGRGKETQ